MKYDTLSPESRCSVSKYFWYLAQSMSIFPMGVQSKPSDLNTNHSLLQTKITTTKKVKHQSTLLIGFQSSFISGSCEDNDDCQAPQVCLYEMCTLEQVDLVDMNNDISSPTNEYGTIEDASEPSTNRLDTLDSFDQKENMEESHLETTSLNSKKSKHRASHRIQQKKGVNITEEMVLDSGGLNDDDEQADRNQVIIDEEEKKDADLITNAKLTDEQSKLQNNREDRKSPFHFIPC